MSRKVQKAAAAGVARWRDELPPRVEPIHLRAAVVSPKTSSLRVLWRGVVWCFAICAWVAGVLWDALRGRRGSEPRAERATRVLQSLGGTFVKAGQQLSLRADMLPPEWCDALAALRDAAPPMERAVALEVIERSTGRSLDALYSDFDWAPIGSASIACVYAATLPSGRRVAVKVRRPDVASGMAADLRLFRWVAWLAEAISMARGDQAVSFVSHMKTVLLEELDFTRELRNLECFRRSCRASGLKWLKAPRPFPERCSSEVLTIALVDALPAGVVLAAAEGDRMAQAQVREAGISPRRAGQRLFRAWNEQIFHFERFHGDPHPANLFVGRGDVLWLVDFGACGSFSEASRRILRRIQVAVLAKDVGEMVQAALALVEPHPPVDMNVVGRKLERMYGDYLASIQSDSAPWWEKATSRFWMSFIDVARDHGIPVNLDTLRLFRASFLMDTLAYRLAPDLDIREEYLWFFKRERDRQKARIYREGIRGADNGPIFMLGQVENAMRVGGRAIQRVERLLDQRSSSFALAASKGAAAAAVAVRTLNGLLAVCVFVGLGGFIASGGVSVVEVDSLNPFAHLDAHLREAMLGETSWGFDDLVSSPLLWFGLAIVMLNGMRGIRKRLEDIDP
jgi:ubiquinone biosynthesis protein